MTLVDQFSRKIDYLRIAVTDRCNLRCRYCMPAAGIDFVNRKELLSYDEILRLAHIFKQSGIKKVRLTGGEPFVRRDMDKLVSDLCEIYDQIYITTNATLIHQHLELLTHPHIKGLNISIDSLNAKRFADITRRDDFQIVYDNIMLCLANGIPIKLNMVVMKGINEDEIPDFVRFGKRHNCEVRFIEAMPFNEHDGNKSVFMPHDDILSILEKNFDSIDAIESTSSSSSIKYEVDGSSSVAIIPAYTRSLCGSCNRIRLTSRGELLTCLYAKIGVDLKHKMRDPSTSDEDLKKIMEVAVLGKKKNGFVEEELRKETVFQSMTSIGG